MITMIIIMYYYYYYYDYTYGLARRPELAMNRNYWHMGLVSFLVAPLAERMR